MQRAVEWIWTDTTSNSKTWHLHSAVDLLWKQSFHQHRAGQKCRSLISQQQYYVNVTECNQLIAFQLSTSNHAYVNLQFYKVLYRYTGSPLSDLGTVFFRQFLTFPVRVRVNVSLLCDPTRFNRPNELFCWVAAESSDLTLFTTQFNKTRECRRVLKQILALTPSTKATTLSRHLGYCLHWFGEKCYFSVHIVSSCLFKNR
jgi:hypothetical protein